MNYIPMHEEVSSRIFHNETMVIPFYSTPKSRISIESQSNVDSVAIKGSDEALPPLPMMVYADSAVVFTVSGFEISFDPHQSIRGSKVRPYEIVDIAILETSPPALRNAASRSQYMNRLKVKHSDLWKSTRDLSSIPELHTEMDWTYTTTYWGSITSTGPTHTSVFAHHTQCVGDFFPMDKLRDTSRPIQTFKEVLFWEDELDDNGHAQFKVRYRLMEDFLFILSSFELHVDDVLSSRSLETRIYVDLSGCPSDPTTILREFKWIEAGSIIPELWTQETIRIV